MTTYNSIQQNPEISKKSEILPEFKSEEWKKIRLEKLSKQCHFICLPNSEDYVACKNGHIWKKDRKKEKFRIVREKENNDLTKQS